MLDKALRNLVHCEFKIGKFKFAFLDVLLTVCITGVAALMHTVIFGISGNPGLAGGTAMLMYCILDFMLAVLMAVFVWKVTGSKLRSVGIYALAVIWPVFVGNSALNGGNEIIAATLLMLLLSAAVRQKNNLHVFWAMVAIVCGFQIGQAGVTGEKLTDCWFNIYTLFSETGFVVEYGTSGKLFVFGALLIVLYYISKLKFAVTPKLIVSAGLFFSLFITCFYPFMNYRSGFFANVFALLLFGLEKRKFYMPMALCIISYVAYSYSYRGEIGIFPWIYALLVLVLTADAGIELYRQLHTKEQA